VGLNAHCPERRGSVHVKSSIPVLHLEYWFLRNIMHASESSLKCCIPSPSADLDRSSIVAISCGPGEEKIQHPVSAFFMVSVVCCSFDVYHDGEKDVSKYLKSGRWRYLVCDSEDEAHDFQWYVIDQLKPPLNIMREPWNQNRAGKYRLLLDKLLESPMVVADQLDSKETGPGVYVFYHQNMPSHSNVSISSGL
jgi:hypothetical protein